ncbi:MAG: caspase family protein [Bacteroidales bacterium]|nr:caspase family protein [Bacteroidales bacterium]
MRAKKIINGKYVVLLIGVSTYEKSKLGDIPNVKANIEELKSLFLDPNFIGVKESDIITSFNENHFEIGRKITDAVEKAKNSDYTLFVYYSGHGVISPQNYHLYFASADIEEKYLDDSGIEAKKILEKISRSQASRKIFLVDACHSGQIHNTMGDVKSNVANLMKDFEGVQYVTACDEYSSALYPKKNPNVPTYFTGAILSRVHKGLDIDRPYLTLRDIVEDISTDFKERANMPIPQISSVQSVDKMPFAYNVINKYFSDFKASISSEKSTKNTETEWEKTVKAGTLVAYYDYMEKFPKSKYAKVAENKVVELEEEEKWQKTENLGTVLAYESYKRAYPAGKYISKANLKISELHNLNKDNDMWTMVCGANTVERYNDYLKAFPKGCHVDEAHTRIKTLRADKIAKRNFIIIFLIAVLGLVVFVPRNTKYTPSVNEIAYETKKDSVIIEEQKEQREQKEQSGATLANIGKPSKVTTTSDKLELADQWCENNEEMNYLTALKYYREAYADDSANIKLAAKIQLLRDKISNAYKFHMECAKVYENADEGFEDAYEEYLLALRLRPDDHEAQAGVERTKSKIK